jgi:adenylate cyclase
MTPQRKLVAVLAADVAGYTSMMEVAEEETHLRLMGLLSDVIEPAVASHRGRIVKSTGDGFLAAFEGPTEAVDCAIRIQTLVAEAAMSDATPMLFRMGINLTEAIIEPHDIFGEGVNLAARLQASAEPGGIVVTTAIAERLQNRHVLKLTDLGELRLKNLRRKVRAFGISGPAAAKLHAVPFTALPDNRPSIIVLPFRLEPGSAHEKWFSEGIIEGIIHILSGIENLFVISRGTSLAYAGQTVDPRAIGVQLGVRYALSGIVRRTRDRLRVFTELADASTGKVLRTDRRDSALGDLFEMQDEIATEVVNAIAPAVHNEELARAMRKPPDNLSAYDLLLRSTSCTSSGSKPSTVPGALSSAEPLPR